MLLVCLPVVVTAQTVLTSGKHNTTPISSCAGYNPARLVFTVAPSGGTPPYYYQWQLNNMAIPGETLNYFDPPQINVPGVYSYNCTITDAAGTMVSTGWKVITIVADPAVSVTGAGSVCLNSPVTLLAFITGGTGNLACQWQSSADNVTFTLIAGATAFSFAPATNTVETWWYRVSIFPAVGSCNNAVSAAVAVTVNGLPATSSIYHY